MGAGVNYAIVLLIDLELNNPTPPSSPCFRPPGDLHVVGVFGGGVKPFAPSHKLCCLLANPSTSCRKQEHILEQLVFT